MTASPATPGPSCWPWVLATLMVAQGDTREGEPDDSPPEVYPLLLFALLGMVLLAAASDLLVVFIALEILSLSLYILAGQTRRLAAQEAASEVLPAGGVLLGVPAVRDRAVLRGHRQHQPAGDRQPCQRRPHRRRHPAAGRGRPAGGRPVQAVPHGPPTSTRAPRPRWPRSWPPPPRWPNSPCSCGCSPGPWAAWWGVVAAGDRRGRRGHHARGGGPGRGPDRPQADARLLLHQPRRLPAGQGLRPPPCPRACPRQCSTCWSTPSW